MPTLDPARLYYQLLNTGLQQKDPQFYQLIYNLIGVLSSLNGSVTTLNGLPSGSSITNVFGFPPLSLEDNDVEGPIGPPGINGLQGLTGLQGPPGDDGLTGEDGIGVPGPIGATGPSGSGTQGIQGPPGDDGSIGEDGIPGPAGAIGATGPVVPWFIPATDTFTVETNNQALFAISIDNEGLIVVDGFLVQVDAIGPTTTIPQVAAFLENIPPYPDDIIACNSSDARELIGTIPLTTLGAGVTSTITTTAVGTQNNFAPGISGDTLIRCNNATDITISGLAAGVAGQQVTIVALGAGNVFLQHQNTGSLAANRFTNLVTSGDTPIAGTTTGHAIYKYDATTATWRMLSHDQGARLTWTPTYSASGLMTFTLVTTTTARYYIKGRIALITYDFTGTVGGTPDVKIFATLPNGYTSPAGCFNTYTIVNSGVTSIMQSRTGLTTLEFYATATGVANWAAGSQHLVGTVETELT